MGSMKKRTREKIALIVFVLLVALAGAVLTSYFATGRSWSVAASFVDDTMGRMKGYTAIVYAGVVEPEEALASEGADGLAPGGEPSADAGAEGGAADASKPGLSLAFPERRDQGDGMSPADSIGLGILSLLPRPVEQEERGVYVSDVRNLYESKDAHVLTLDASNLERYLDPQVFYVGDTRIGVYAIEMYTSRVRVSRILSYFESCDVDTVVCLTPRVGYLSTCQGTDVVIVTSDAEGVSSGGEMRDSTLVAGSPDKGDVGVILLTSSNVASARVVSVV